MTDYIIFQTEQDALDRSRLAWEDKLGRKKNPEDVTEFLWHVEVGKDGRAAVIVNDNQDKLTAEDVTVASLDANWVIAKDAQIADES
jgi:hypothetical protein